VEGGGRGTPKWLYNVVYICVSKERRVCIMQGWRRYHRDEGAAYQPESRERLTVSWPFTNRFLLPIHCNKRLAVFPVPSRDVTYQTLPGREYLNFFPAKGLVSDISAGDGKVANLFLQCRCARWSANKFRKITNLRTS
jgi:hypothetical protein